MPGCPIYVKTTIQRSLSFTCLLSQYCVSETIVWQTSLLIDKKHCLHYLPAFSDTSLAVKFWLFGSTRKVTAGPTTL